LIAASTSGDEDIAGSESGLEQALADWLESSGKVRQALKVLLVKPD
jgi:hypothetical protein